jgi:ABC-type transport system involved in cytochrome c biogenesis ATPase subunit
MVVMLPERGAVEALAKLEVLQKGYRVLDRPYARLDMRADGRLVAQARQMLSAAPPPVIAAAAQQRGA